DWNRIHSYEPTTPASGLLAVAYSFFGMRPDSYASRPASTPSFMARAIFTESSAAAIAVFISTPSAPSSMAMAASDAVRPPASTIIGTCLIVPRRIRRGVGCWMRRLDPIGGPDFAPQHRGAHGFIGRVAARGVGQNEDFGSVDIIEQRFLGAIRQIDPAHRHRHHTRLARLVTPLHLLKTAILAGSHDEARRELPAGDDQFERHASIVIGNSPRYASLAGSLRPGTYRKCSPQAG